MEDHPEQGSDEQAESETCGYHQDRQREYESFKSNLIMDYKEKYEQALERARQFGEKPYLEDSAGIVEYIFPELKESEDENKFWVAVEALEDAGKFEIADWFKAIKDRVLPQPRQECSKEDERIIDNLISQLGNLFTRKLIKEETKDKYVKWLKSLRIQSQWKPSVEQIEALDFAIDCIVWEEFCIKRKVLKGLLEQLRKL
jgi:hypothetical protein